MPVEYCEHDWPMNSNCPHCELVGLRIDAAKAINLSRFRKGPLEDADWEKYDGQAILTCNRYTQWDVVDVCREDRRLWHGDMSYQCKYVAYWFPLSEVEDE